MSEVNTSISVLWPEQWWKRTVTSFPDLERRQRVALLGFGRAGIGVLRWLYAQRDRFEVELWTHGPTPDQPDIRDVASLLGIECHEVSVNDVQDPDGLDAFRWLCPDVVASVCYRERVLPRVLDYVAGRAFNVHPSLLPLHRGCSAVPWQIIEGDQHAGVTFHYMTERFDDGDVILQLAEQVADDETAASLFTKLEERMVQYWPAALELVLAGFPGAAQRGRSSYHGRGCPYDGKLEYVPLDSRARFVRAMHYPPMPPATYDGKPVCEEDYLKGRNS
jgi:methionyl-tRNA formyltransferase